MCSVDWRIFEGMNGVQSFMSLYIDTLILIKNMY